jgi:hypothetical protein
VQWDQEPATPENCPWLGKAHLDGAAAFGDALAVSFHTAENEVGVVLYHPASGMWEPLMSSMDTEWGPLAQGLVTEIGDLASYDGDLLLLASGAGRREIRGIWRMARTSVVPEMMCWLPPGNLSLCGDVIWFRDYGCLARIAPGEGIAEVLLGRDLLYPPAGPERPWRTRESPFIPESGTGALSANSSLSRLMDLRGAALHGDTIWARLGQSQLILLHRGRPLPEGTILDNAILEGRQAVEFLSTSYGLVAIGDGDIGLIGERP